MTKSNFLEWTIIDSEVLELIYQKINKFKELHFSFKSFPPCESFANLSCEIIDEETQEIAIAHYYEINGDMVPEIEMTFCRIEENVFAFKSFKQCTPYQHCRYVTATEEERYEAEDAINYWQNTWQNNIIVKGYLVDNEMPINFFVGNGLAIDMGKSITDEEWFELLDLSERGGYWDQYKQASNHTSAVDFLYEIIKTKDEETKKKFLKKILCISNLPQNEINEKASSWYKFLSPFYPKFNIFYTSYDSILYKMLLCINDDNASFQNFRFFDGFSKGLYKQNNFFSNPNLFCLHGALHLYSDSFPDFELTHKLNRNKDLNLNEVIADKIEGENSYFDQLLLVAGNEETKKSKIENSLYLTDCIRYMQKTKNKICVTFGFNFNEADSHIVKEILKKSNRVIVGYHHETDDETQSETYKNISKFLSENETNEYVKINEISFINTNKDNYFESIQNKICEFKYEDVPKISDEYKGGYF